MVELPEVKPTGWVRVILKDRWETVRAATFGEAASKVKCGAGQIIRFEHAEKPA